MMGWLPLRRRSPAHLHVRNGGVDARELVVVLHGYGADAKQIPGLLPLRPRPSTHVFAPEGFLTVRDGGRAWFPVRLDAEGSPDADPQEVELALDRLRELLSELRLRARSPRAALTLVGYSQGATLVLETLLSGRDLGLCRAAAFAGLPLRSTDRAPTRPVPIFLGNGTHDPFVPEAAHRRTVERLEALGHPVHARRDPVPHVVARAALHDLETWLP